jgi:soluble lytic murein transglycosylase-like protein
VAVVSAFHEPVVSGAGPGAEQWRSLVAAYFPPEHVETVLRMLQCESGGDPLAYSAGNYGLLQINAVHAARVGGNLEALYDPETNIRVGRDIWRDNAGFGPWACY